MIVAFFISVLLIERTLWASPLDFNTTTKDGIQTCITPGCNKAAWDIWYFMNVNLDPCDNFYEFVCNGIAQYTVPDKGFSISTIGKSYDRIKQKLKETIEKKIEKNDPEALKKLQSHYHTCLEVENVDRNSTQLLLDVLRDLGDWPVLVGNSWNESTFDWKNLTYKLRRFGYFNSINYLISFGLELDEENYQKYIISLGAATTGLSYEYLIEGKTNGQVLDYYKYMVSMAQILGVNMWYAAFDLAESLLFEMKLANISLSIEERRNRSLLYNPMTVDELESKYPDVPWKEYINEMLYPYYTINSTEQVIVRNPSYLKSISELISKTPKRVIANYAIWRVIHESAPVVKDFRLQLKTYGYTTLEMPSQDECLNYVTDHMPTAVGALYVRKDFDKNLKKTVTKLVDELLKSFEISMEKVNWMDQNTKTKALKKLKSIDAHVAYPEELLDNSILDKYFENITVAPNSYLDSYLSFSLFKFNDLVRHLRIPYNATDWTVHGSSTTVNAFYHPTKNSIDIPAGYIQEELFAIDRPNYMNYAAIGTTIGHELSHAFDAGNIKFDENGKMVDWWDPNTRKQYEKRAECIREQYSNYTVKEIGMRVDGIRTQSENIADNGGVKHAYLAYEEYERRNGPEPRLPGLPFSSRQLFWITNANIYCQKSTIEYLRNVLFPGQHSPSEFRVVGPFSNMPEFSRDFNCSAGSGMNPPKKCQFW